jgi:phosphoglycolate phosphatase
VQANFIFKEEIVKKEPELYDGISEVLHELRKRYTLVLISSTYKEEVEQKLRKYGILDVFEMILAKEHHLQSGGKVDHIKSTIRFYGLHPEEVVSVGDRAIDYAKGTEAGLKNIILVEYGWGYSTEQVPGYERRVIVKKPRDILKAVKAF